MSEHKRILFDPKSKEPFQLSRYRIERFMDCPRCFWLDLRRGIKRPEPHPYTLNSAVDSLLKIEFDKYRLAQRPHPIMIENKIPGVPYDHPNISDWRLTTKGKGLRTLFSPRIEVMGAPDDLWLIADSSNRLSISVVDYKATSSKRAPLPIGDEWWLSYRRQLDIYVWLLQRMNLEYPISDTSFFLLLNGESERKEFDWKLHFKPHIVKYAARDSWVDLAIANAEECLMSNRVPFYSMKCEYCRYRNSARKFI